MHPHVIEYILRAKRQLLAIRFAKTEEELKNIEDPASRRAQYLLARLTFWKGETKAALEILDKLLENPTEASPLVLKARYLEDHKKYRQALDLLRKAASLDPDSQRVCINSARLLRKLNNPKAALKASKKAVQLNSKNPAAWYQLGLAYYSSGKNSEAINSLGVAIRLNPDYFNAFQALANIALNTGRSKELIPVFEIGLKHNPNSVPLRYVVSQLCADQKDFHRAAFHCVEMVKRTDYYSDFFRLGMFSLADGKQKQAEYAIQEAFKRNPEGIATELLKSAEPGSPTYSQLVGILERVRTM